MSIDPSAIPGATERPAPADDELASDAAVQAALAGLAAKSAARPKLPRPGEAKYRLTMLLFPAILLVFVALYVSSLASGVEPEVSLLWAGGASVVLAILGRAAVGILGDDARLVLNDNQIVAMARSEAVRDYLAGARDERGSSGDEQPSTTAQAAAAGGKE